jgi:predicted dehydrogenase
VLRIDNERTGAVARSENTTAGAATTRAAIIGAGQIARQHIACLKETPGVEVAGVCDLSPAVAEMVAERYLVPAWFTDHRAMLAEVRPDVVHVTTPPTSHFRLGMDSLEAGAHVILEKPATVTLEEVERLAERSRELGRVLVEDYNYLYNRAPREILRRVESGELGAVVHVEVLICLDILGPGGFADPNVRHPVLAMAGGAIADFLPHLASLAHLFVGSHRRVATSWVKRKDTILPHDEFHAVVEAERGTAVLGFSSSAQPDGFWLRVHGEKGSAAANLFETRLTFERVRGGPRPIQTVQNALEEGKLVRRQAVTGFLAKFGSGVGTYEGLWELVRRTYAALQERREPPVTLAQLLEVNRLVAALKPEGGPR